MSQSNQTLISSFFWSSLLSLAISKYRQYFLILQTLKLNKKKRPKVFILHRKKLVGLTKDSFSCFFFSLSFHNANFSLSIFLSWTVSWRKERVKYILGVSALPHFLYAFLFFGVSFSNKITAEMDSVKPPLI